MHPGFRYAPGLDGLRALAVLAVFTYHLGTTGPGDHFLQGGFIGVDIFFVLSGYLITSLLLVEMRDKGRISIKKFYIRRARRLLPALFAFMIVIGTIGAVWLPQQAARLRGDLLASLAYVTNWWLIAQDTSYFGTGERPPLLTHLWSLAVEEQFYLVWPLLLIMLVRRGRGALLAVLIGAIAASTILAAILFDPWGDPSRVYFGTDTRAATPLIGAAAAILVRPWRRGNARHRLEGAQRRHGHDRLRGASSRARRGRAAQPYGLNLLGLLALAGLGTIAVLLGDYDPLLYQGGFLVIALLAAVVVVAAGDPGTALGKLLALPPLRWIGDRSYAIYLWHWPVCVLTRPGIDIPLTGWANSALRLALALSLAELSHWLVERPIRHGNLFRLRARLPGMRLATAFVTTVAVLGAGAVGWGLTRVGHAPTWALGDQTPIDSGPEVTLRPVVVESKAPRTPPIKVAIFGDSQGRSLFANKPADIGKYLILSDETISACGILRGRVASRSGERFDLVKSCPNWISAWSRDAAQAKPEVALVMIGAWEVFDLITPTGKLVFGTPEWDAEFQATLAQGIQVLQASGAQVVLALLPCYRPIRASAGYWPERGDDDRVRHVNELLKQAAATVEPAEDFCTDPVISTSKTYRWDGVHYYKKGAALYFDAVVPQLLALPA